MHDLLSDHLVLVGERGEDISVHDDGLPIGQLCFDFITSEYIAEAEEVKSCQWIFGSIHYFSDS